MKKIFIVILGLIGTNLFAFNGEIVLNYTHFNAGDLKVENVVWQFKNDKAKMIMTMKDEKGKEIISSFIPEKSSASLIIYSNTPSADGKNYYYQVGVNSIEDHHKTDYRSEVTSDKKQILGYECTKYLVYTGSTITEMWIASTIDMNYGEWAAFYKTNSEMQGLKQLGIKGFPLESTTKTLAGNIIYQYTTTQVSSKTIEDKEFSVPSGYVLVKNNK